MFGNMVLQSSTKGGKGMEENVHEGILSDGPVNLPLQMMSLTDRDGKMTPRWFRLETDDHEIRMYRIFQFL